MMIGWGLLLAGEWAVPRSASFQDSTSLQTPRRESSTSLPCSTGSSPGSQKAVPAQGLGSGRPSGWAAARGRRLEDLGSSPRRSHCEVAGGTTCSPCTCRGPHRRSVPESEAGASHLLPAPSRRAPGPAPGALAAGGAADSELWSVSGGAAFCVPMF